MSRITYKAFIAYSHADTRAAEWLQRALESYRVPSRLVGQQGRWGKITRRLGPIFRDREELAAGDNLSVTIDEALKHSEFLIVVCSPASRHSQWVNAEIAEYKKYHDHSQVLCFIADGEPFAANDPSREYLECFPKALEVLACDSDINATIEPIAADYRKSGDGKRLAKLKIVAGLLGIGLDELIQREAHRRQRNLLSVTFASATGMLVMAVLMFVAFDARQNEELRRAEAEDLIEFMLSDLRDRLQAVGRLDVLDAVGQKAIEYYSNVELSEHSDSSLGRRARAFHLLGEVDDLEGNMGSARVAFEEAFNTTAELLERSPDNGELIFNHAQSVYWLGYLDWRLGNVSSARSAFESYRDMAEQLTQLDTDNMDWLMEASYASLNLGVTELESSSGQSALPYFEEALAGFQKAAERMPGNVNSLMQVAQSHAYIADVYEQSGSFQLAGEQRLAEIDIYNKILSREPANQRIKYSSNVSQLALGDIRMSQGQTEEAIVAYEQSRAGWRELINFEPGNTFNKQSMAAVLGDLGESYPYVGKFQEAETALNTATDLIDELLLIDSAVPDWNVSFCGLLMARAKNLQLLGKYEDSTELLAEAASRLITLQSDHPDVNSFKYALLEVQSYTALAQATLGQSNDARATANLAIQGYLASGVELSPAHNAHLALAHSLAGNFSSARDLLAELDQMNYAHPELNAVKAVLESGSKDK